MKNKNLLYFFFSFSSSPSFNGWNPHVLGQNRKLAPKEGAAFFQPSPEGWQLGSATGPSRRRFSVTHSFKYQKKAMASLAGKHTLSHTPIILHKTLRGLYDLYSSYSQMLGGSMLDPFIVFTSLLIVCSFTHPK